MTANAYTHLRELILACEKDAVKYYDKKNDSAGTRLRKSMQSIKAQAQIVRDEVVAKRHEAKP